MNCYNCENEVRDKENQKICYDNCESYQKMKKRNNVIRINRRKENFKNNVIVSSVVRNTKKMPGRRIRL